MKKCFKQFLLLALVCATGLFAGSCKKETLTPEEQKAKEEQERAEKTDRFWDVVGQLVAASDYTTDYKGKTFEPVIGIPDESDAQTRIVLSNSAAAAAKSFAGLVNVDTIDENTATYTWTQEEVGTLTYTKKSGTAWAEVNVAIPAIPHLSKIIYRSAQQADGNGSFEGSAYYRFGDVVSLVNKSGIKEYWVCVRPAFGPEGKEDSHWMCVGDLPEENVWSYTGSNKKEYAFPTGLKYSKEHMQNFAEMLFALCYPDTWSQNITNYSTQGFWGPGGLPMFHDFSMTNLKYHNANFWANVAETWRDKGIDLLVLGTSLDALAQKLTGPGIYFLYKGYSWWTSTSNYATVYQAQFVNTPGSVHANMQTEKPYTDQKVQMIYKNQPQKDIREFDVRNKKSVIYEDFFGDANPRYIVRYATGADLASDKKTPSVYYPIPGTTDVYRYHTDIHPVENLGFQLPEITESRIVNKAQSQNKSAFNGVAQYKLGNVYMDEEGKKWFVVNMAGSNGEADAESSPYTELLSVEGLMAMQNGLYAYPLPTYDQTLRGTLFLSDMFRYGYKARGKNIKDAEGVMEQVAIHLRDMQVVDISDLFSQTIKSSHTASIAYAPVDNDYSKGQPLFRLVYPHSDMPDNTPYYFWCHYPSHPDANTKVYTDFSSESIYLQDMASSEKVLAHANDYYAAHIRTEADRYAANVSNYFYSHRNMGKDMWNTPVLMFRMDAVYDRGTEYATRTVNGHLLKPYELCPAFYIFDSDSESEVEDYNRVIRQAYNYKAQLWKEMKAGLLYVDGETKQPASWQEVWNK